jgi:hypothetical protein
LIADRQQVLSVDFADVLSPEEELASAVVQLVARLQIVAVGIRGKWIGVILNALVLCRMDWLGSRP